MAVSKNILSKATISKKNGKPCIYYLAAHNRYTNTLEQETAMLHAYRDQQAQGIVITGRLLANETGTSVGHALMLLRLHRTETRKEASAQQLQQHFEEVCTRLEAQAEATRAFDARSTCRTDD